jgi:hypothetical protein
MDLQVTLMNWGNCIIRKVEKVASGEVSALEGELHLEGNVKETKKKLTWVADGVLLAVVCVMVQVQLQQQVQVQTQVHVCTGTHRETRSLH